MSGKRFESAEDLIAKGNSAFVDELFDDALEAYNAALELEDDNHEAFLKRAAAHYALKNFAESIADASKVIALKPTCADAYFRKGMGLFAEDEFESAKAAFVTGKTYATDAKKFNMWIRKCDVELEESGAMPASKSAPAPVSKPSVEASSKMDVDASPSSSVPVEKPISSATASSASVEGEKPAPRYRHEWFQTDTHVSVDLFAKGVKASNLEVLIEEQNLTITIKLAEGSEFVLDLELADKIIVAESKYELLSTKIEVRLKKSKVARWKTLENTGEASTATWDIKHEGTPNPASLYPSSRGAKNWDQIAKSDEEEKLTGDHALNNLFRTIYKDASEEQRRAMMKSYVESNGTVLSTNWEEVGQGEVKGQAPAGMEMHSWTESRDQRSEFKKKK
jgi:suppressor of G2 allele of SKP1